VTEFDPRWAEFATPTQRRYLALIAEHGTARKVEIALGLGNDTVQKCVRAMKRKAAAKGYAPEYDMTRPAPAGFSVKGASTYYNADGKPVGQWIKTNRDHAETEEILREFAAELCKEVKPLPKIKARAPHGDADLMACYVLGDPHFGMRAWAPEAGEDFDLDIADRVTKGAVDRLVGSAPSAATALLLNLGDMFHADNQNNQSKSGHQLDVDGRYRKVQRVGMLAMVYAVRRLLEKHARVIVRVNSGNHDDLSSHALAMMLDCFFHQEPRVEIDLSPAVHWYLEFGAVLIGSTHGDRAKGPDLPGIMATDKAEAWGRTQFRYWYLGHVHHSDKKEYRGAMVEYFRTLAAKDAWHAGEGYRSGRDMQLIVLHRQFGETERHRCDVAMLA
jgi:hypothetical protein